MLVFTGYNTLLLPLKRHVLPIPQPSPVPSPSSPNNFGAQLNTDVAAVNVNRGHVEIWELVRSGLFSFAFGRHTFIYPYTESIACIAGHARSPLLAIGLKEQMLVMSAASFQLLLTIDPNDSFFKYWMPNSVALRNDALFVSATYGNLADEDSLSAICSC